MAEFGLFLSSEEHPARVLVDHARAGEEAGFRSALISDHFHPWIEEQGESPFVWSVIGAIAATTDLKVTTGVTCPTVRVHPAVIAQAAATSQSLLDGRFVLGVGSGEALNEHILGHRWPPVETRLEMLEEAIAVIRDLWTGRPVTHHGRYFTVENARLYSLPPTPPPIVVSAFGPEAADLAARAGDGLVTVSPDPDVLERYRSKGAEGPLIGAVKVCWGPDEGEARRLAHDRWATESLPGQLAQELAVPAHFEQASSLVTEDMVADSIPCGPDPERHVAALEKFVEAGFDEIYVNQIGDDLAGFLDFWTTEIRPRLNG